MPNNPSLLNKHSSLIREDKATAVQQQPPRKLRRLVPGPVSAAGRVLSPRLVEDVNEKALVVEGTTTAPGGIFDDTASFFLDELDDMLAV